MSCIDAPCCGCCDPQNGYVSPELADEMDEDCYDDSMDGDHDSAMASAGWGMDEDYGCFAEDMHCEGYDEN